MHDVGSIADRFLATARTPVDDRLAHLEHHVSRLNHAVVWLGVCLIVGAALTIAGFVLVLTTL